MIIDSEREVNYGFSNGFSEQILGDSEIMVSSKALYHLGVSDFKKEKI